MWVILSQQVPAAVRSAMMDDKGRRVKEAGPSMPVEILGLGDVPNAGEILMSFKSDKEAKNFAGSLCCKNKANLLEETKSVS